MKAFIGIAWLIKSDAGQILAMARRLKIHVVSPSGEIAIAELETSAGMGEELLQAQAAAVANHISVHIAEILV